MTDAHVLGIDIGGSSVKGAIIDVSIGAMVSDRLEFPHHPLPNLTSLVASINNIRGQSGYDGDQAGIGFPGVVLGTRILNGPNIGNEVRGTTLSESINGLGLNNTLLNDADAALYHAIRNTDICRGHDTALMITIGTSIGTALSQGGRLIRNIELGRVHDEKGNRLDENASQKARLAYNMPIDQWAMQLSKAIRHISLLTSPDIVLLSGGVTESPRGWFDKIEANADLAIAPGSNKAGIIGSACWHHDSKK
tara:strand:+ start:14715 stop:15467 length:753 start_codon:yes stop_codon:yes gene_type:complete